MPEFPHAVEMLVTNLCTSIYTAWNLPQKKAHVVTRRSPYRSACPNIQPAPLTPVLTSASHATHTIDWCRGGKKYLHIFPWQLFIIIRTEMYITEQATQDPYWNVRYSEEATHNPYRNVGHIQEATDNPYRNVRHVREATHNPYRNVRHIQEATHNPYRNVWHREEANHNPYRNVRHS